MLRNEVGWFDEEENSADTLSMRLANDATFVRATFSNRLSIFIQDSAAVIVALLIGMLLQWRLALVALATLPVLTISAVAQVCMLYFVVKFFVFLIIFQKSHAKTLLSECTCTLSAIHLCLEIKKVFIFYFLKIKPINTNFTSKFLDLISTFEQCF